MYKYTFDKIAFVEATKGTLTEALAEVNTTLELNKIDNNDVLSVESSSAPYYTSTGCSVRAFYRERPRRSILPSDI